MTQKKKYNVSVNPAVNDRMLEHVRFLAQVSIPAAERLYLSMEDAIAELESNPEICPLFNVPTFEDVDLRYKLCAKRYRIVFEISEKNVYVYDIQDCRQNSDKNLI